MEHCVIFFILLVIGVHGQKEESVVQYCNEQQRAGPDFPALDNIKSSMPPRVQEAAAMALIQRILPSRAGEFSVKVTPPECLGPVDRDTFILEMEVTGHLTITASSGYAAAWGFHYYLKHYCGCMITWAGRQLNVPSPLPTLYAEVKVTSNDRFRYYQNVCTSSYSYVWWNWTQWEREIDWMALNGINLPLALNGQEAIWQRVYRGLGLTQAEIDNHFAGPAFLAWFRIGNLRGWGGPLPQSWHDQQVALQHQILQRMREFGMTPVLPAFAGHVPSGLARVFPDARMTKLGPWGNLDGAIFQTYLLDPMDPLFIYIGGLFVSEMMREFGTDHVYSADTFNEMTPPSSDPSYLSAVGRAVYNGIQATDPSAVWVIQGWLFLDEEFWQPPEAEALLTSVPKGHMIVLDLAADINPQHRRLDSFCGQPFIWCMLHNFGGNLPVYGKLPSINEEPFESRQMEDSSMIGTGLTPEGISQNEVVYEFMNENSWRKYPRNITEWILGYAVRRYGLSNAYAEQAWQLLKRSVYNCSDWHEDHTRDVIITTRPRLYNPLRPDVWYNPVDVFNAWYFLLKTADTVHTNDLFRYDLVDVTRQSLQLIAVQYYEEIVKHYEARKHVLLMKSGDKLLELLSDLDMILGSDKHFLLGSWLEAAKALATNDEEEKLYEYNARIQITLWGPNGEIRDYAKKQWSGLVKSFYMKRWQMFIRSLDIALSKNTSFDQAVFNSDLFYQVEQPFTFDGNSFPTKPQDIEFRVDHPPYCF